ncbi:MAG: hypothetical protein IJN68_05655 [Clostridia bacterium]|nr:hypothetical protein [Clostridia bacterium]
MKKKTVIILLAVIAVLQLLFPLSFMAYEKIAMNAVVEKGASYTLEYSKFNHFYKESVHLNTDDLYTVGYTMDIEQLKGYTNFIPANTLSVYRKVVIRENENGIYEFYDAETCDSSLIEKDNWFNVQSAFFIRFEEYDFVNESIGLRELVELANYVSDEYVDESFDVDGFLAEDGYYGGFYMVPFEGKITLKVYNGFAKITELYLGDELILTLK